MAHICLKETNENRECAECDQKYLSEAVKELLTTANDFQYPHEVVLHRRLLHGSDLKQEPDDDDCEDIDYHGADTQDDTEQGRDEGEFVPDNDEDDDDEDYGTAHLSFPLLSSRRKGRKNRSSGKTCEGSESIKGKVKCEKCDKMFPSQARLKAHVVVHSDVKPFQCKYCDKRFLRSCTLTAHEITHTGQKPFSCAVCNKNFADRSTLAVHHRTHTGERPYGCDECGKRFNNPGHLKRHKRIHSGERPYKCHECSRCFGQQMSLKVHLRTHSGSRPFSCDICGTQFIHSSHVNRHKKRAHNKKS